MVENYLLEELVTFAKVGTLAKTAEYLGLTQPAVTHSMKKLEDELGISLFDRQSNKISLNENGKYTVREAAKLLNYSNDFVKRVQQFAQNQTTILLAANAPGPLIVARRLHDKKIKIKDNLVQEGFEKELINGQITCLLTNQQLNDRDIRSIYLGTEKMSINLPVSSDLLKKKKLSYNSLANLTILSPSLIGFWQQIEEKIPGIKLIYQDQATDYAQIINYSNFPYFTTNLAKLDPNWGITLPGNRMTKALSDKQAQ